MSIVITGGSGFLGVSIAERLLQAGVDEPLILTPAFLSTRGSNACAQRSHFTRVISPTRALPPVSSIKPLRLFHFASLVSGGA